MKRRMLGSAALGLALLVTGCGAGQITQTDTQQAGVNGAKAQVGNIVIRDATLTFPETEDSGPAVYQPGSDVDLRMSIVNEGTTADELVSASSDAATDVAIEGSSTVYGGNTLRIGPVPPDLEDVEDGRLILRDLTTQVRPGELVTLTLTFRDAGRVTLQMPIAGPDEVPPTRAYEGDEAGGEGH